MAPEENQYKRPPVFNPLDKKNLGESVSEHMLSSPTELLPPEPFIGAGIYAIYYSGDFDLYKKIAAKNKKGKYKRPIYVGKAIPPGGRKGGVGFDADPTPALYKRLVEHAESIKQSSNLGLKDFCCRYLVVDDIWIPLAESLLIEMFSPLWNLVIDGFGNHDPGSGRHKQQRSPWDVLHPGRNWAEKLQENKVNITELRKRIKEFK